MDEKERQPLIILIVSIIFAAGLMAALLERAYPLLTGSESDSEPADAEENAGPRVVIFTSDTTADQSWGSLAYEGKMLIEESFDAEADLYSEIEGYDNKITIVEEKIEKEEPDLIIGHGGEFSEPFSVVADKFQDLQFVTLHGEPTHENEAAYTFDHAAAEFLAAWPAVEKTETGRIGILEAEADKGEHEHFGYGIEYYGEGTELYHEHLASRNDGDEAVQVMDELLEKGVDVFYSKGNAYNQHVIEYAVENDVYVIGYIDNQSYMAENHVLTSVLNRVPMAYNAIMIDFESAEGIEHGTHMLTHDDGVYDLAKLGPMFSEEQQDEFLSEWEKIKDGDLRMTP